MRVNVLAARSQWKCDNDRRRSVACDVLRRSTGNLGFVAARWVHGLDHHDNNDAIELKDNNDNK